jgi:hypothetical protein
VRVLTVMTSYITRKSRTLFTHHLCLTLVLLHLQGNSNMTIQCLSKRASWFNLRSFSAQFAIVVSFSLLMTFFLHMTFEYRLTIPSTNYNLLKLTDTILKSDNGLQSIIKSHSVTGNSSIESFPGLVWLMSFPNR